MDNTETKVVDNWRSRVMLLTLVVGPCFAITGGYFSRANAIDNRISAIELRTDQTFAAKSTVEAIQQDINAIKIDMARIKTLLETSRR